MTSSAAGALISRWAPPVLFAIALVFAVGLFWEAVNPSAFSQDGYWHLRMGQDLVENGASPWQDNYSYSFAGEPIKTPPVVFQTSLYLTTEAFGLRGGFQAFTLVCLLGCLALMLLWAHRQQAPLPAAAIATCALASLLSFRAFARPELISYLLIVLAFFLYDKALRRFATGTLLTITALLVFWSNHHNPLFGYLIFFGLFLDIFVRKLSGDATQPSWKSWITWGFILVAAGFLQPRGTHFLIEQYRFDTRWTDIITEYLSARDAFPAADFTGFLFGSVSLIIAWSLIRRRWGYAVILGIATFGFWKYSRLVSPLAIVMTCIFVSLAGREPWQQHLENAKRLTTALVLVFVCLALGSLGTTAVNGASFDRTPIVPDDIVKYMEFRSLQGPVFNRYRTGGYLIHRRAQSNPVFIDGRSVILYPYEHFESYRQIASGLQEPKLEADFFLWTKEPAPFRIWQAKGYALEMISDDYLLMSRNADARLATAGDLLVTPFCWDGTSTPQIRLELENAEREAKEANLGIAPDLGFIRRVLLAKDPLPILAEAKDADFFSTSTTHFAAQGLSLLNAQLESTLALEQKFPPASFEQALALSFAHFGLGNTDVAEAIIEAEIIKKEFISISAYKLLVELIYAIEQRRPLQMLDPTLGPRIAKDLTDVGIVVDLERDISLSNLCELE